MNFSSQTTANLNEANTFKIPSSDVKNYAHKKRIATRKLDKKSSVKSDTTETSTSNSGGGFKKGAYVALSNGVLRRVEDMRTEDFIVSADLSQQYEVKEATVVKITEKSAEIVVITFSYDKNQTKVDTEVSQAHPFFVYGQGWAACNPADSLKTYDLNCQRLQVGDICICIMLRREHKSETVNADTSNVMNTSVETGGQHSQLIMEPNTTPTTTTQFLNPPPHAAVNNNFNISAMYHLTSMQYQAALAAAASAAMNLVTAQNCTYNDVPAETFNGCSTASPPMELFNHVYANNLYQHYQNLHNASVEQECEKSIDLSYPLTQTLMTPTSVQDQHFYYNPSALAEAKHFLNTHNYNMEQQNMDMP